MMASAMEPMLFEQIRENLFNGNYETEDSSSDENCDICSNKDPILPMNSSLKISHSSNGGSRSVEEVARES